MDAVRLLTEDHRSFEALYQRYVAARSPRLRDDLAQRLLQEARLHIALEEKYVYPIAIERSGAHLDEHVQAKVSLAELGVMQVDDPGFESRLASFAQQLLEHSTEEERLFFPALRKTMGRAELEALGRLIQNAREARPEEPMVGGLMARAVTHVAGACKVQINKVFERAFSAVLCPRTSHP